MPSLELQQNHVAIAPLMARLMEIEQSHREELQSRDLHIKLLTEQVRLLRIQKYGSTSEKYSPDQLGLALNEAESLAAVADTASDEALIVVSTHERKSRGHRKALAADLPRVEVIHDLAESDKTCPHDGTALQVIGHDTSEQLDYIPAKIQVLKHVRLKYGCPCCEQTVKLAIKPAQILPKSNASSSLLAHIVTAKYADGLPLYRQETQFFRLGVQLPRATSARWIIQLGSEKLMPLINLLNEHLLHAGCWAHVCRKFDEAKKVTASASIERNRADDMLALIRELYVIERQLKERNANDAGRLTTRQQHSVLIIEKIKAALDTQAKEVLPKSLLGKALSYTLNQ